MQNIYGGATMIELAPVTLNLDLVKQYLRIDHDYDDTELSLYLSCAISYVSNYIKAEDTEIIDNVELFIPILNLVSYFYEYKTTILPTSTKVSDIFKMILDTHRSDLV